MTSRQAVSRRHFLRLSTTLAAGIYAAPAIVRAQAQQGKLRLAVIGAQGKGGDNIGQLSKAGFEIVSLCDVDSKNVDKAKAQVEKISGGTFSGKTYTDYRKLFDDTSSFDAVVVSTPDHHHFPATIRALKAKKHVYCEKPLVHTIGEVRKISAAAKEAGVATQMGNQGNASEDLRLTTEWIEAGLIGKVKEVHSWSNRPIWPQGVTWPTKADEIPKELDWDLWLGPAPERPYYKECHPFKWRGFWDFGTGAFGDMGCHILNWPFTALDLGSPISAECVKEEGTTKDSPPKKSVIRLDFAAKGNRPALSLFWHDGGFLPEEEKWGVDPATAREDSKKTENGTLFIGEKGILYDDYDKGGPTLLPRDKMADFKAPEKTLPRSPGHHKEFMDACTGGKKAGSDFVAKACGLTEMVLIGHLAARVGPGKKIEWDNAAGKVKNIPEANQYVNKPYRKGWVD